MSINLLDVAKNYKEESQQNKALDYLQSKLPDNVMAEFERIWREAPSKPSPQKKESATMTISPDFKLLNFFQYYDENNANHVAAVEALEKAAPGELQMPNAAWVVAFRSGQNPTGAVDLHAFFKYFSEKNAGHLKGVEKLQESLPSELATDEAEWVKKFREKPKTPPELRLAVPYFNQVDNYRDAHRTCNSSSCAMCLEFLKPGTLKGAKGDDAYVQKVFAIGDTTDHAVQTKVLASYGVKSYFSYNLGYSDIDKSLAAGKPVVIGILHRGTLSAPTGGHMCVVVGKTAKGDYIVNDPYGSCNDAYQGPVTNGKGTIYTKYMLNYRWLENGKDKTGWGRIFV